MNQEAFIISFPDNPERMFLVTVTTSSVSPNVDNMVIQVGIAKESPDATAITPAEFIRVQEEFIIRKIK